MPIPKPNEVKQTDSKPATTESTTPPADDNLDELGYEKPAPAPGESKPVPKPGEKTASGYDKPDEVDEKPDEEKPDEKPVEPASGYEKPPEDPKDEKPDEEKPDEKPDDKGDKEFKVKDKGELHDDEVKEIEEFVKKHKVDPKVAEALVEQKKAEVSKIKAAMLDRQKQMKLAEAKLKRQWYDELKNDPAFGGEKFDFNVKQVDKVLEEYFPNVKKKLTEDKGMLPPYIMRDMAKLADHLYSGESLIHGDPQKPRQTEEEENDPLAFYNS